MAKVTLHTSYSPEEKEVKFRIRNTPALNYEYMVSEMVEAGNRNKSKHATPFDACFIMREGRSQYFPGAYPVFVQQIAFFSIALFGKIFGLIKVKPKAHYL